MLATPTKYTLVAGSAEGRTRLNAFDNALLKAGIGNLNLLKVSSILPPGAVETYPLKVAPGSLMPTAYGSLTSSEPGELIAAAIGVGVTSEGFGLIMEFSGRCGREEADEAVREMVREGIEVRGLELVKLHSLAVEHKVEKNGCVIAAAALWY